MIRPNTGRMWRDDHVRHIPKWTRRIKRFAFENVEHRAAKAAALKRCEESRRINNTATGNVNNDCPGIQQGDVFGPDQAVGFGNERKIREALRSTPPVRPYDLQTAARADPAAGG
jgi:hypothetical protein